MLRWCRVRPWPHLLGRLAGARVRASCCPTLRGCEGCSPPAASARGGAHSLSALPAPHRGLGDPAGPGPPRQLGPKTVNSREHASRCKPASPEPAARASSTGAHPLGQRPPAPPPWAGSMRLGRALRPEPAATIQTRPCSALMGEQTSGRAHQTGKPVTHMDQLSQAGPRPPGTQFPKDSQHCRQLARQAPRRRGSWGAPITAPSAWPLR